MPEPCERAFRRIADRDWDAWTGLPPDCTPAELESSLDKLSAASGRGRIGTRPVTTEFKTLELAGFRKPLKVYLRDDRVVLVAIEFPEIERAHARFRAVFGEPAAKLDYYQRTIAYRDSAYVYPDRGLALLYNPDRSALIRIYLFAPTSLETYERELHHPVSPARRLPRR